MTEIYKGARERRWPRVMAPVLCGEVRHSAKKKPIANLSLGGVRIYSDERLEVGQELQLEFFLPNGSILKARAKVIWIKELPPAAPAVYDVGLEFAALSMKAREELEIILRPQK